jgi:ribosomal protein S3AE
MAKQKAKKIMKKSFFEVSAPMITTKIQLYSTSPEALDNKTVKIDLTKNLRGKNLILTLRIKNENGKLVSIPETLQLENSYIRKAMRRGTDYVEDSFQVQCRDSVVRIKPLLITRKRVSRAILKALRETAQKNIEVYLKTRNSQEIISDIITNKLQKNLLPKLKKVYPLALCEIRMFDVISQEQPSKEESLSPEVQQ